MKKILWSVVTILVVGVGFYWFKGSVTSQKNREASVLLVGTADDFPPFCFNKDGVIVGFDIDVAHAVADKLQKSVQLKNMDFDILLLELQDDTVDLLAAGLTATPERAERVFFTEPYLTGDPLVAVQSQRQELQKHFLPEDLLHKKVVVNDGYTADHYVTKLGIDPLRVTTVAEGLFALKSGQADYYITALTPIKEVLAAHPEEYAITPLESTQENCAMAISKNNPELLKVINNALQELKQEGALDVLKNKWGI